MQVLFQNPAHYYQHIPLKEDWHKVWIRESFVELKSTYNIDIKQGDSSLWLDLDDLRLCRTVHVRVNLAVLNELVICNHLLKSCMINEVVVSSIDFSFPRCSRSERDWEAEFFGETAFCQRLDQCSLADTWRTCNYERSIFLTRVEAV